MTHLIEDVEKGTAFVVIEGRSFNNSKDVPKALELGANLLIVPRRLPYTVDQIVAENTRKAAEDIADEVYREWRGLKLVGITGTNGKTTTSFLIRDALRRLGYPPALIGTVFWDDLHAEREAKLTTPEGFYILRILGRAARKGAKFGVMEVSSIALVQGRVDRLEFDVGVLTNVGWDHIDYHGSFEEYVRAKTLLFKKSKKALINLDDPNSSTFMSEASGQVFTYGKGKGDFPFEMVNESGEGLDIEVLGRRIKTSLLGDFNAYNLTAAFASVVLLGFSERDVAEALNGVGGPPGRLQRVISKPFSAFVDYAHTPDAIDRVLRVLRPHYSRLIVVFGAGGNRDRGKRPKMAEAVERWADVAVLTSDNPRWEDPKSIIEDVRRGFKNKEPIVLEDRKEAIYEAVRLADEGDAVVVLGKGHEKYQEIRGKKHPFDDVEVLKEALKDSGIL